MIWLRHELHLTVHKETKASIGEVILMNDKMKEIYTAASTCTKCPLYKTKTNCVFGCGNENADLMFVGEAPGEAEDNAGVPFVGAAGQLFDR